MELWYTERHTPNVGLIVRVKETIFVGRSAYQSVEVIETIEYGKMLLLDGLVMTSEWDEFIYHEMIVHPAMFTHPDPRDVLVIGGGDGGAVREVMKHGTISRAVLCEIDGLVVETCKRHFPEISCTLEGNEHVEVVLQDGIRYVEDKSARYDLILIDSTDPIGQAEGLFGADFYSKCFRSLRPDGILVAQSESPFYSLELILRMKKNLEKAGFPIVRFYCGSVPTYPSGLWSWVMASKRYDPMVDFSPKRVEERAVATRYYNVGIHQGAFALPEFFAMEVGQG